MSAPTVNRGVRQQPSHAEKCAETILHAVDERFKGYANLILRAAQDALKGEEVIKEFTPSTWHEAFGVLLDHFSSDIPPLVHDNLTQAYSLVAPEGVL